MGWITTHVLDTANGTPAVGMRVTFTRLDGAPKLICDILTNADGRCDKPVLDKDAYATGNYELMFYVGDYFRRVGPKLPDRPFLEQVPIRFGATEDAHYHVPLLVSPYAYSTYRGS